MYELGKCNAAVHSVKGPWFGCIKTDKRFQFDTWAGNVFVDETSYAHITGVPFLLTDGGRIRMNLYRLYMSVILFVESYRYDEQYAAMVKKHLTKRIHQLLEELKGKD